MESMKCPNCNHSISREMKFCPGCGMPIDFGVQQPPNIEPQKKSKGSIRNVIIMGVIALLFIFVIVYIAIRPNLDYHTAKSCLANGEYDKAIELFENLGDYSNAREKVKEATYAKASRLLEDGQYDSALAIFEGLGDFSDSKEQVSECTYRKAHQLYKAKEYTEAINLFNTINEYKDTAAQITECYYAAACEKFAEGRYQEALSDLLQIMKEKNVSELYQKIAEKDPQCVYSKAIELYNDGEFKQAADLFQDISTYADAQLYQERAVFMNKLQGTWKDEKYESFLIFEKWKITDIYIHRIIYNDKVSVNHYKCRFEKESNDYILYTTAGGDDCKVEWDSIENRIVETYLANEYVSYYAYASKSTNPNDVIPETPRIGMTKAEVRKSLWGEPEDINKTTTAYGTREQWVYSGYRYIYFENGIVTSIQE